MKISVTINQHGPKALELIYREEGATATPAELEADMDFRKMYRAWVEAGCKGGHATIVEKKIGTVQTFRPQEKK